MKKFIAILLCVLLIYGIFPTGVFAESVQDVEQERSMPAEQQNEYENIPNADNQEKQEDAELNENMLFEPEIAEDIGEKQTESFMLEEMISEEEISLKGDNSDDGKMEVPLPIQIKNTFSYNGTGINFLDAIDFGLAGIMASQITDPTKIIVDYSDEGEAITLSMTEETLGYMYSSNLNETLPGKYYFVFTESDGYEYAGECAAGVNAETGETINYIVFQIEIIPGVISEPVQKAHQFIYDGEEIDLIKGNIDFPTYEERYILNDGNEIITDSGYSVAVAESNKGYINVANTNGLVNSVGKYYLLYSPAPGFVMDNENGYALFEFEVESKYEVIEGTDNKWVTDISEDGLTFRSNGEYELFVGAEVDGIRLSSSDYSSWSGSTFIKLKPSFLNTLEDGEHVLTFIFVDGMASTQFSVTDMSLVPSIETVVVCDDTGGNTLPISENNNVTCKFTCSNLEVNTTYAVVAWFADKDTGIILTDKQGKIIESSARFVADERYSDGEIHFKINTTELAGKTIILLANLVENNTIISANSDMTELKQALFVPDMDSNVSVNGNREGLASAKTVVTDSVSYTNLVSGQKYTLVANLLDKETESYIVDTDNNPLSFSKDFIAGKSEGNTNIDIKINTLKLEGRKLVVYETLYLNGKVIAEHKDINDEQQTICFPQISSLATVKGNKTAPADEITIIDTVSYTNLIPGNTYCFETKAVLPLESEDGKYSLLTDVQNKAVSVKTEFTAESESGEMQIKVPVDASKLQGKTIVIFEDLFKGTETIAQHRNLTNKDQTIYIAGISGSLSDVEGSDVLRVSPEVNLRETVKYNNLEPGKVYSIVTTLKTRDSEVTAVDNNGEKITSTVMFSPEVNNGYEEILLSFNGGNMEGAVLSADIELYCDGILMDLQKGSGNEKQTIYFPTIHTCADNGNGEKDLIVKDNVSVVDTITYSGFKPNTQYSIVGNIIETATGENVINNGGKQCLETVPFTAEDCSGTVKIVFNVDTTKYCGKDLVVFEKVFYGNELITAHEDTRAENQILHVKTSPAVFVKDASTGEMLNGAEILLKDMTIGIDTVITTGEDGIAYHALISGHQYSFTEQKAPDGYEKDDNTYHFKVDENGSVNEKVQTLINKRKGSVIIKMTNVKTGAPVEGATISVFNTNGNAVHTQKTDKFGQIYFESSKYISESDQKKDVKFTFREMGTPSGYYLDGNTYNFTVKSDGTVSGTTEFVGCPLGTVAIMKTDSYGSRLSGARLSVYSGSGTLLGQATTNSKGQIYFTAPAAGTYYFIEDQAPYGYVRADAKFAFKIVSDGTVSGTTTFQNALYSGSGVATGDDLQIFADLCVAISAVVGVLLMAILIKKRGEVLWGIRK